MSGCVAVGLNIDDNDTKLDDALINAFSFIVTHKHDFCAFYGHWAPASGRFLLLLSS